MCRTHCARHGDILERVETLLLGSIILVSFVLLVSGAAKLADPRGTHDALVALRIPARRLHRALAVGLPLVELLLAVALWLPWPPLPLIAVGLSVCAFAAFTLVIARALRFDEPVSCACFGTLGSPSVTLRTLIRTLILVLVAALGVAGAATGAAPAAVLATSAGSVVATALLVVLTAAVAVLALGTSPEVKTGTDEPEAADLEYVATPLPFGQLRDADGATLALHEVVATEAHLLVFLSTTCGPCLRMLDQLAALRERVSPTVQIDVVVSRPIVQLEETVRHRAHPGLWEDPESNVARTFGISGRPAAVLLGADGTVAGGPVTGETDVTTLIDEMAEQLRDAGLV